MEVSGSVSKCHCTSDPVEDLKLLLECLKYEQDDIGYQEQALKTIASLCNTSDQASKYLVHSDGLKYILRMLFLTSESDTVRVACLQVLCAACENNVEGQQALCREEMFFLLKKFLKMGSAPVLQTLSCYLLICLVTSNEKGQVLARETKCLDTLWYLFKDVCSPKPNRMTEFLASDGPDRQESTSLWQSVTNALSLCVNNPQNDENQVLCSSVFPAAVAYLRNSKSPLIRVSTLSFLSNCLANNHRVQANFRLVGGLRVLSDLLREELSSDNQVALPVLNNLVIALEVAVCGNDVCRNVTAELQILPLLLRCLHLGSPKFRTKCLMSIATCMENSVPNFKTFMSKEGITTLARMLVENQNCGELQRAAKCVLETCVEQSKSFDSTTLNEAISSEVTQGGDPDQTVNSDANVYPSTSAGARSVRSCKTGKSNLAEQSSSLSPAKRNGTFGGEAVIQNNEGATSSGDLDRSSGITVNTFYKRSKSSVKQKGKELNALQISSNKDTNTNRDHDQFTTEPPGREKRSTATDSKNYGTNKSIGVSAKRPFASHQMLTSNVIEDENQDVSDQRRGNSSSAPEGRHVASVKEDGGPGARASLKVDPSQSSEDSGGPSTVRKGQSNHHPVDRALTANDNATGTTNKFHGHALSNTSRVNTIRCSDRSSSSSALKDRGPAVSNTRPMDTACASVANRTASANKEQGHEQSKRYPKDDGFGRDNIGTRMACKEPSLKNQSQESSNTRRFITGCGSVVNSSVGAFEDREDQDDDVSSPRATSGSVKNSACTGLFKNHDRKASNTRRPRMTFSSKRRSSASDVKELGRGLSKQRGTNSSVKNSSASAFHGQSQHPTDSRRRDAAFTFDRNTSASTFVDEANEVSNLRRMDALCSSVENSSASTSKDQGYDLNSTRRRDTLCTSSQGNELSGKRRSYSFVRNSVASTFHGLDLSGARRTDTQCSSVEDSSASTSKRTKYQDGEVSNNLSVRDNNNTASFRNVRGYDRSGDKSNMGSQSDHKRPSTPTCRTNQAARKPDDVVLVTPGFEDMRYDPSESHDENHCQSENAVKKGRHQINVTHISDSSSDVWATPRGTELTMVGSKSSLAREPTDVTQASKKAHLGNHGREIPSSHARSGTSKSNEHMDDSDFDSGPGAQHDYHSENTRLGRLASLSSCVLLTEGDSSGKTFDVKDDYTWSTCGPVSKTISHVPWAGTAGDEGSETSSDSAAEMERFDVEERNSPLPSLKRSFLCSTRSNETVVRSATSSNETRQHANVDGNKDFKARNRTRPLAAKNLFERTTKCLGCYGTLATLNSRNILSSLRSNIGTCPLHRMFALDLTTALRSYQRFLATNKRSPNFSYTSSDARCCNSPSKLRRRRCFFTPEEEKNLREGVYKYGFDWKKILSHYEFNERRVSRDLRDKWRNMSKFVLDH